MMSAEELDAWLDAAVASFEELAASALAMDGAWTEETRGGFPAEGSGATVPILAATPMQVGVFGSPDACRALTNALLGAAPGDEGPSESDIADALGEIVNIMAGRMKTRMHNSGAKLGVPLFLRGHIEGGTHHTARTATLCRGDIKAEVLMMCEQARPSLVVRHR